ncbi:MAG: long-chain-fatty-acid--CoA ligase [Chloroflexi bacterium]|nr:long-chain-fatty-acid--CoA ligase [Chloroflexota bacterium]
MNTADFLTLAQSMAPDKEAIIFEGKRLTFSDLNARANRLAHALQTWGIRKGDPVGMMQVNCNEVVEAYFACAKLGAIFVPLSFRGKAEEVRHVVNASESRVVLAGLRYVPLVEGLRADLGKVGHFVSLEGAAPGWTEYESLLRGQPDDDISTDVSDDDITILMFTAGTTGLPKGVMLSYESVGAYSLSNVIPLEPDQVEKNILTVPLYHIAGMQAVVSAVFGGRTLVIERQFEPSDWMKLVQDEKVERAMMVPTMLKNLLDHPERAKFDLSSLKTITYGAAPMPKEVIKRAIKEMPTTRFINAFGQTESAATITALLPEDHVLEGTDAEIEKKLERLSSIGKPLPGVEIRIVDEEGREVSAGTVGEIVARGPQLMKGYWKQEAATQQTIRGGWLFTGDLGYFDEDGYIFLAGRAKDFIKRAGEMISPEEVEQALMSHPAVDEAAIIGVPDDDWGERVRAIVVLKPGNTPPTEAELIEYCRQRLASFKKPESVVFSAEPLPRNPLGKVLKRDLRARYSQPITTPA